MGEYYQQFWNARVGAEAYIRMSNKPDDLVRERMKIGINHFSLTMLESLSSLVFLLMLFGSSNGQYRLCNVNIKETIQPGYPCTISITTIGDNYQPLTYRWFMESDRPMILTCNKFDVPQSSECHKDALTIQDGNARGRRYCGGPEALTYTTVNNKMSITVSTTPFHRGIELFCTIKAACECGWKKTTRIVGGEETGVNEYPMMAAVIDTQLYQVMCGATIISVKHVLTGAHCMGVGPHARKPEAIGVLVGDHDLTTGKETSAARLHHVDSYVIHDQYNADTSDYDIALITVNKTIQFNADVGPACLPFHHRVLSFNSEYCDILGWGSKGFSDGPVNRLQKARVKIIDNQECARDYKYLTKRDICTKEPNRDSCQWDSGGPLLWQSPSRRLVLIGVIQSGSICANGQAAKNVRVGEIIDWIVENTPRGIEYCDVE